MRKILGIVASIIIMSCAGDAGVKFENMVLAQALEKAKSENKMVMLDFYSPT